MGLWTRPPKHSDFTLDTSGRVQIQDGTSAGQLDTDSGTVLLRSATETQIDNIETDTAAVDTTTEMRTFLTGSDTALSTLTTSDNIGVNLDDISGTLDAGEIGSDAITADKLADNAFSEEHFDEDIAGFNIYDILEFLGAKAAGKRTRTIDGDNWDIFYYGLDDLTGAGTPVIEQQDVDSDGQVTGTITLTP